MGNLGADHENEPGTQISPESLPPLGPTAEVPAVHRDDTITPESLNQKFAEPDAVVPLEHRDDKTNQKSGSRWTKPAAIFGVAGLVSGAYFIGTNSGESKPTTSDSSDFVSEDTEPFTSDDLDEVEITLPPAAFEETEALGILKPVLMTATSYDGLLEQLKTNMYCMYNNRNSEAQQECLKYIVGNKTGKLTLALQDRLAAVNDYRTEHPSYELTIDFSDPTPGDLSDNIVFDGNNFARVLVQLSDPSGSTIQSYFFERMPTSAHQLNVESADSMAWFMYREETL